MTDQPKEVAMLPAEPTFVVNGTTLNTSEAMTLRVALTDFLLQLETGTPCGADEHGRMMQAGYLNHGRAILALMFASPPKGAQTPWNGPVSSV